MRRHIIAAVVAGWLAGASCMLLLSGQYSYRLLPTHYCDRFKDLGIDFDRGTEIVPNQPNPCYLRDARFHLP